MSGGGEVAEGLTTDVMGPEASIERKLVRWAKSAGIIPIKLSSPTAVGQPDRCFLKNGRAVFIEVKAPGAKPRTLQLHWLERLRDEGFPAVWGSDFEELRKWLAYQLLRDE